MEPPVRPASQNRINDQIRASRVRLIDENNQQVGIKQTTEAIEYAYSKGLDLVEIAAQNDPPVAKVMDYGKFRYEQEQKAKQARKHQQQIHIKEIKLRPKIQVHDYNTKKGHVERFLRGEDPHLSALLVHQTDALCADLLVYSLVPLARDLPVEIRPAAARSQRPFIKLSASSL